jgi:hypothetical protein
MIRQRIHAGLKRAVEAVAGRNGHHQGRPRSWRRQRHRAAYCG